MPLKSHFFFLHILFLFIVLKRLSDFIYFWFDPCSMLLKTLSIFIFPFWISTSQSVCKFCFGESFFLARGKSEKRCTFSMDVDWDLNLCFKTTTEPKDEGKIKKPKPFCGSLIVHPHTIFCKVQNFALLKEKGWAWAFICFSCILYAFLFLFFWTQKLPFPCN